FPTQCPMTPNATNTPIPDRDAYVDIKTLQKQRSCYPSQQFFKKRYKKYVKHFKCTAIKLAPRNIFSQILSFDSQVAASSMQDASHCLTDVALEWSWDKASVVQTGINVCQRVSEVHQRGFVHCDINSANLIVGEDLDISVIDFGSATRIGGHPRYPDERRCQWQAPELSEFYPISAKADTYSVGAILRQLFSKVEHVTGMEDVLRAALDKDPEQRPSLTEVIEALKSLDIGQSR
ncbi:serine/threonine-protein kinase STY13-like, partial [Penaeus japonicus]|uniref:serine/threonine-protein kinase STY13-like n=1 Tax=Penaeus japonicus TaxID=27405 RepID=UPI001C70E86E